MRKTRGFTEEKKSFLNGVISRLFLTAHADEVAGTPTDAAPTAPTPASAPQINYEQLIAAARKEEKDKLYPQIEKLKAEKEGLVNASNQQLIKIGDLTQAVTALQKQVDGYKSGKATSEELAAIQKERDALKEQIAKLEKETPSEEQLRAQIEKEFEVKSYLKDKKRDNKDIIPSIFDSLVSGATIEEVDASIAKAKERSDAIKRELGLIDEKGNAVSKTPKKKEEKSGAGGLVPPTNPPAANPADTSTESVVFDADYIRSLDPASPEYAEFRKKIGLK